MDSCTEVHVQKENINEEERTMGTNTPQSFATLGSLPYLMNAKN